MIHEGTNAEDCQDCTESQQLLCELLDSETTPERAAEIRAMIQRCPQCFSRFEREQAARTLVQECCGGAHAPENLRDKIASSLGSQYRV